MTRKERIEKKLKADFSPAFLEVIDESHFHAGHMGARPEGETHYRVKMQAEVFKGKLRVAQHRLVNSALEGEFNDGLHALALELSA